MAYSKGLDKELYFANIQSEDGTVLRVSVFSYNGGDKKLQIGPRIYTKKDGEEGYRKAGRLTEGETEQLVDILPTIQSYLVTGTLPAKI